MGLITSAIIAGGAIYGASRMMKGSKKSSTPPPAQPAPLPKPPAIDAAATEAAAAKAGTAQVTSRRKAMARSKSVFTSPLGIGGQAQTIKKKLLGQ